MITKFNLFEQYDISEEFESKFFIGGDYIYYLYSIDGRDKRHEVETTTLTFTFSNIDKWGSCETLYIPKDDFYSNKYYTPEEFCNKYERMCVDIYRRIIQDRDELFGMNIREELIEKLEKLEPIKIIMYSNKYNL